MNQRNFSEVESYPDFKTIAERWLRYWEEERLVTRLMAKNSNGSIFSFIDGPITANNPMGVHHAWGRTLKDVIQRFKSMQGYNQRLQNGFDCQGLWVEVETEKDLRLKSKKDIEEYGLENFSWKCRERVMTFATMIEKQSKKLGQWMDWSNSYFTMSDENIECIWHFLKVCNENGLLYKGLKVMPWCARCGTALSQQELLDSYQEVVHKAIYLKLPIIHDESRFFLVWTTTPWTLTSNIALAVNPDNEYIEVSHQGSKLILAKAMISCLDGDYEILRKLQGSQLEGMEYVGPFDDLPAQKGVKHKVILWSEVGKEGTGVVHIAPGCGQEDFELGEKYNLPAICPIDENGFFLKGFGALAGKSVFDVNEEIFETLTKKGLVYKIHDFQHRYPNCWRCHREIVFRLVKEWFLAVPKLRQLMLDEVAKVNWKPDFGRNLMEDWLNAMGDWCISRKRFWGLPLPFYECKNGHFELISSKKELLEKATNKDLSLPELHRPWIDKIKISCSECGEDMSRVPEVGDCWLDAGIVPFSTLNYLNDREFWRHWFPSELVLEMKEQVRLWFYSLLVMSCVLERRAPFKTVVMYQRVVDKNGEAMHRSKGNVIWFDDAIERMGADVVRWLYCSQNTRYDLRFGYSSGVKAARVLSIFWNVYRFFVTYASVDRPEVNPNRISKVDDILDRWIISRLNSTLLKVTDALNEYNVQETTKEIEELVFDLANWYVRRSRRRFWKAATDEQKRQAYDVLYYVLVTTVKMLAPIVPFFSEEIFQNLVRSLDSSSPTSVHLSDFPKVNLDLVKRGLEEDMSLVRKTVEMGLSIRFEKELKTRQPLAKIRVLVDDVDLSKHLRNLILEELNVKDYDQAFTGEYIENDYGTLHLKMLLDTTLSKDLQEEGFIRELVRHVQRMRKDMGLHIEDRIRLFVADESGFVAEVLTRWLDYIKQETLGEEVLVKNHKDSKTHRIGDREVSLAIERAH